MTSRTWSDLPLTPEHAALLESSAVTPDVAAAHGLHSITDLAELPAEFAWAGERAVPALAFPWRTPSGVKLVQLRPDTPVVVPGEKRPRKYLWRKDCGSPIGVVREDPDGPVIFVEGTKQALAAAGCVTSGAVYAIAGCRSWSRDGIPEADLDVVEGRKVIVIFDADVETNAEVWEAARKFKRALEQEGAADVRFALLAAGGTAGLDDVLGRRASDKRAALLERLLEGASGSLPKKPPKRDTPAEPLGSADRPPVAVNDDRLNVIDNITGCLRRRWDGEVIFNFGGVIAERDGAVISPVDRDHFVDLVQQVATTVSLSDKGEMTYAEPSATVMAAALSRARSYTRLDRVATVPFVRADGTIRQAAGYDEATATYLVEALDVVVPDDPDAEEVAAAVKLLCDEWLGDLFASLPTAADRANALGLVLTPLVRGLVPVAPLAVVNGLGPGVGKNLLGDMVTIFATGATVLPLPWAAEEDERRKALLAAFRTGRELFVFDEAHVVEGASLARALTAATYTDRVLGVSLTAEFPNNVTWMSLGNNVQINGDMARRAYVIRMEPTEANPMDRDVDSFRHPDLKGWTVEHRAELVAAGLTLVRAWFVAGRPQSRAGRRFGSFEAWGGMVGGILDNAGVPGFLGNLQEWRSESDYDGRYWADHLGWLAERYGPAEEFTVADVVALMRRANHVEHPPGLVDHDSKGYTRELGKAYGKVKGRVYAGLRLRLSTLSPKHANRWVLERVGEEGSGTPHPGPVAPDDNGVCEDGPVRTDNMGVRPVTSEGWRDQEGCHNLRAYENSSLDDHVRDNTRTRGADPIPLIPLIPQNRTDPVVTTTFFEQPLPPNRTDPVVNGHENRTDHDMNGANMDTIVRADPARPWAPTAGPTPSPVVGLLELVDSDVPVRYGTCFECDGPLTPVPPAGLWRACAACHPSTFRRR